MDAMETEDIKEWLERVLDERINGDLLEALQDGTILCRVANAIEPGSTKFKQSNMPFVQRENIASFLNACEKIGVPHHELFETVDLHELSNPKQVVITLRSLSRHAHQRNGTIPVIGPKLTSPNQRKGGFKNPGDIPAWNTRQYGYIGGASQGTEGVVMGGRRDIVTRENTTKTGVSSPNIMIPSEKVPPAKPPKPLNLSNVRPVKPKGPRPSAFDESDSDDGKNIQEKQQSLMSSASSNQPKLEFSSSDDNDGSDGDEDSDAAMLEAEEEGGFQAGFNKVQKSGKSEGPKPKYMSDLLNAKKVRDVDRLRAQNTKIKREREAEGDMYDDKEVFVTDAYKKQQQDMAKASELEDIADSTSGTDVGRFMKSLREPKRDQPQTLSSRRSRRDETQAILEQMEEQRRANELAEQQKKQEQIDQLKSEKSDRLKAIQAARERYLARKNNK